jgi:NADP-dependent 3-hydroxy acid dehydrogenase YdfG
MRARCRFRTSAVYFTDFREAGGSLSAARSHLPNGHAQLALVTRSGDALERLAAELSREGDKTFAIRADLADFAGLDLLVASAHAALGSIDVLINNAGIDGIRSYPDESDAQTEEMLRVDLLSPMLLTRRVLPAMLAQGAGQIVNIASLAGKISPPHMVSYSIAKAGLIAFTHGLRADLRDGRKRVCRITGLRHRRRHIRQTGTRVRCSCLAAGRHRQSRASGAAVLSALRTDTAEFAVSPGPVRMMQAFNQVAPDTMSRMQDLLGVSEMLRSIAVAERPKAG